MVNKSIAGLIFLITMSFGAIADDASSSTDVNPACDDANVFTNIITQICWDCFLDSLIIFGVGSKPNGASDKLNIPVCACTDALGIPEFGFPLGFWSPTKINEVVTTPWCSPSLGGIKLQDSLTGLGQSQLRKVGDSEMPSGFFQYHYFSYPIMAMLEMMVLPGCSDEYIDMDLLYVSEIDPMWNDDILSLLLNPEAIIFSTPLAFAWCAIDCALTTAGNQQEEFYGCAGCDGSLYPMTGNVFPLIDPVAGTSLITQRVLASLHRKGLAKRTIGDEAMCDTEFFPTIPRTQYKFSMMYPVPESSTDASKVIVPSLANPSDIEEVAANNSDNDAGTAGVAAEPLLECCHDMGMSTARWCVPVGGRVRPGKDNAYIYMIWNYRNCCIRNYGGNGGDGGGGWR